MNESSSPNIPSRSGSHAAAAGTSTMRMPTRSGCGDDAAEASALGMSTRSGTVVSAAAGESRDSVSQMNSWNQFQKEHAGKGWGSEKMRAEYWRQRATGRSPK